MSDERYSVTFDFLSKGGTPLVMQSPPLGGAGGAGGPGARGRNSAGADQGASIWGPLLLAAVLRGGISGLSRVKKIPQPKTKTTPPRTDVFTGNKDLMDSIPHRNVTPAEMAKARRDAIRAQMEAAAAKQRNRTLRGENKELNEKNTQLSGNLSTEALEHGLTKGKLLKMESEEAFRFINRSRGQVGRQLREKDDIMKDLLKVNVEKSMPLTVTPTGNTGLPLVPKVSRTEQPESLGVAQGKSKSSRNLEGIEERTLDISDTQRRTKITEAGVAQ